MAAASDFSSGLTRERLTELFDIDPVAGTVKWKSCPRPGLNGKDAGCLNCHGYVVIGIDGRIYRRGRLIWFYAHGTWPAVEVDHVNLVKSDDRIGKLREATFSQNLCNTPLYANNKSGTKGVDWRPKKRRWRARIAIGSKRICLGHYEILEDAVAIREAALTQYHGEFARAA